MPTGTERLFRRQSETERCVLIARLCTNLFFRVTKCEGRFARRHPARFFAELSYEAAAEAGVWDRPALEQQSAFPANDRTAFCAHTRSCFLRFAIQNSAMDSKTASAA